MLEILYAEKWDLVIAFPPCTDLSAACAGYWPKKIEDGRLPRAKDFFLALWNAPASRVAVENPVGWMNTNFRKPDQIVNPFEFGHPWRKKTCLWLRNLPKLQPTNVVEPAGYWVASQRGALKDGKRLVNTVANSAAYGAKTAKKRAETFPGIAEAMAEQWGSLGP